ncbi:MAG TPA: urease accessory protein UreD, partial [Candidatus Manganitrophaceae bacterium]
MRGVLDITFERREEKTVVREVFQQAPLRVVRPFYPEGESPAHLYLLNTTGGILEGDRMETTVRLEKGAHLLATTPAATRVHPSPSGEACQKMVFFLGAGAVLEYLPEPLLLYADAAFHQETDIYIEEGGALFFIDILAPGRLARGEAFAYRWYENRLRIYDGGGLLVQEGFRLAPQERRLDVVVAMEGYTHLGSLYVVCPDREAEGLLEAFRSAPAP